MSDFDFIFHDSRIVIRDFYGVPSHPAFSKRVLTDTLWKQSAARGAMPGLRRFDLRPFDADDLDERAARAISLDYEPHFEDRFNRLRNWKSNVSAQEKAFRAERRADLVARKAALSTDPSPGEDDEIELKSIASRLAEIEPSQPGYLEEVPNGFGDGGSALYSSLQEPNVPSHRISNFFLDQDSPFCLDLLFYKPHEEQADWKHDIWWDRYRLTFRESAVEFTAFKAKLTPAQIAAKEAELNELLDLGRIARDDKNFKAQKKRAIQGVKDAATAAGRSGAKLSESEKASIKALEREIDERWKSKSAREGAENDAIRKLKKELYESQQSVSLGQKFDSFFNQRLTLSFFPQKRGFVSIELEGAQIWSYEDREITAKNRHGEVQAATMWRRCKLELKSNGGAYKWRVGWPQPGRGQLTIGPFDPGFDLDGQTYTVTGQWDGAPGADVEWSVIGEGREWFVIAALSPGSPPVEVRGQDDSVLAGRAFPFLYDASLFIQPGERTGTYGIIWDSRNHRGEEDVSPVMELSPSWDDKGGLAIGVTLSNTPTEARPDGMLSNALETFPNDLDGRLVDIYVDDLDGAPYLAGGIIRQANLSGMESAGADSAPAAGASVSFSALDRRALLGMAMRDRPIGDGLPLGQHVKDVLRCRGELEAELSEIGSVGNRLDVAALGEDPANQPGQGAGYSSYLDDLLETQGLISTTPLSLLWRSRAGGGYWSLEGEPDTIESVDNGEGQLVLAEFSSAADYGGRLWFRDNIELPDDDSEVWNIFQMEGFRDPKTKEPLSVTYPVWESIGKRGDLRHLGYEKPHPLVRVDAIRDLETLRRSAIGLSQRKCKSKKFRKGKIGFFRELRKGSLIRIDGLRCEIVRFDGPSVASDEMGVLARRLE